VLQKKTKGTKCSDNHTFSFVTDTAKVVARIIESTRLGVQEVRPHLFDTRK
jgi:hypothetical protein